MRAQLAADGPGPGHGRSWQGGISLESRSSQTKRLMPPGQVQPHVPHAAELAVCDQTIEQDYRELKGALGLDHVEGRGWPGWHHHVTLVSVAHGFLTLERLRSPNLVASA
jgi:hypothetical protein